METESFYAYPISSDIGSNQTLDKWSLLWWITSKWFRSGACFHSNLAGRHNMILYIIHLWPQYLRGLTCIWYSCYINIWTLNEYISISIFISRTFIAFNIFQIVWIYISICLKIHVCQIDFLRNLSCNWILANICISLP